MRSNPDSGYIMEQRRCLMADYLHAYHKPPSHPLEAPEILELSCIQSPDLLFDRNNSTKVHLYQVPQDQMVAPASPWSLCDEVAC